MQRYEQYLVQTYALRVLGFEGPKKKTRPDGRTVAWFVQNASTLGFSKPKFDFQDLEFDSRPVDPKVWGALAPIVAGLANRHCAPPPPSSLERRMVWLGTMLGLSALEAQILQAVVRVVLVVPLLELLLRIDGGYGDGANSRGLDLLIGRGLRRIHDALKPNAPLRLLGLIEELPSGDYAPSATVLRIVHMHTCDPDRIRAAFVGKTKSAELAWEDFDHLGAGPQLAERLLKGALAKRARGVSILLYGPPGTGKTAFARVLAERVDAHSIFVGELDDNENEPSRAARVAALAISQILAASAGRTMLVVDEADDIFTGVDDGDAKSRVGSKIFMNRLVEGTPAPTVWITNHRWRLGEAIMRRMSLAIAFPDPTPAARQRIVERIRARRKVRLSPDALDHLSRVQASPAVMDLAFGVAKLTDGGESEIEQAAVSVTKAMGQLRAPLSLAGATPFDPALSEADLDLSALADQLCRSKNKALSLCLHGPSGTGKSAYARYVASRLGLEVMEKRASDLLLMWVGQTERLIAEAFQEAADRGAMLILDEADSLLRDRDVAQRSWEVTQVNEMLTWMERHPYPFACTTNLMHSLDPATLRRFLFKVRFLAMRPDQAREAFRRSFGTEPPPRINSLDNLTPGDFALVARKAEVMETREPEALVQMLEAEVDAKSGATRRRIGFSRL
jgi:SpoVK/Ycf46/Vps4 family AAA+-type ATPase